MIGDDYTYDIGGILEKIGGKIEVVDIAIESGAAEKFIHYDPISK